MLSLSTNIGTRSSDFGARGSEIGVRKPENGARKTENGKRSAKTGNRKTERGKRKTELGVPVASVVKRLVVSVVRPSVRPSVVCHKKKRKIFITGDLESITTSKRENNDEIRRILAYVYLVELKAVSFSAFSTFF